MNDSQIRGRCHRPVARMVGERLLLTPYLRREVVGELAREAARAARYPSSAGVWFGEAADRQAFAASVAAERLAELHLRLGEPLGTFRALRTAAWEALGGEAYDHGSQALPARFLRIRFYLLLDRLQACCTADPRLRDLARDAALAREARRLGGRYL